MTVTTNAELRTFFPLIDGLRLLGCMEDLGAPKVVSGKDGWLTPMVTLTPNGV